MKTKTKRSLKLLAFALVLATVFSVTAIPGGFLASALERGFSAILPLGGAVDGTEIPEVKHNPYDVNVSVGQLYPVIRSDMLSNWRWTDAVYGYETHEYGQQVHSPYYTFSIAPWMTYDVTDGTEVTGSLPYREAKENMLHGDLTMEDGFMRIYPVRDIGGYGYGMDEHEVLDLSVLERYGLNIDQLSLRTQVKHTSGTVSVGGYHIIDGKLVYYSQYSDKRAGDKESYVHADLPLAGAGAYSALYLDVRDYYTEGLISDIGVYLLDDTLPSVTDIEIERVEREDHTAELVLTMTFNEAVRFQNDHFSAFDDLFVELELYDLDAKKASTARLYMEKQADSKTLIYRGDIGEYNYRNYEIRRVKRASFGAYDNFTVTQAAIDLADEMYVSAYKTEDFNNNVQYIERFQYFSTPIMAMCDVAGNPINVDSIVNWNLGSPRYVSNSFEVTELEVYNEYTLGRAEGKLSGKAEAYEMIAGPANTLTLFAYLDTYLTEEEGKAVKAELNIKNADGTPVTVRGTSVSDYRVDEVYGGVTAGTLLKFENIRLSPDAVFDGAADGKEEPVIRVTRLTDEIPDKTVYQKCPDPTTTVYADLTSPASAARIYAAETVTDEAGKTKAYLVSIELTGEDVKDYARISGLLDTYADVRVGAAAAEDTEVYYFFSHGADGVNAPETKEEYVDTATLPADGTTVPVGAFKVMNAEARAYLHLYIESNSLYLDGLHVSYRLCDLAGNETGSDALVQDYRIDERAPALSLSGLPLTATPDNTGMLARVKVAASDPSGVARLEYFVVGEESAEWKPLVTDSGECDVSAVWEKTYGGFDADASRVYTETLLVRAEDSYGNLSAITEYALTVSAEKPIPVVTVKGDLMAVNQLPPLTVSPGNPSALGGRTPLVRVTLSPENSSYLYMTVVSEADTEVFSLAGKQWYRVTVNGSQFATVESCPILGESANLDEAHLLYELLTSYGEVDVSFEGGFDDMTPVAGEYLHSAPYAGSYFKSGAHYKVRFASPYLTSLDVHRVDFGALYDRAGNAVMKDTDPGAAPYRFDADTRTLNPMRNAQLEYRVENIANGAFGLLDLDTEASFSELLYYRRDGDTPRVIAKGALTPTATQYFTIGSYHDDGSIFETGAYFLRVHVKSRTGFAASFESAVFVLDAETADDAGLWEYTYWSKASPDSIMSDTMTGETYRTTETPHYAVDSPFDSLGVSVARRPGEQMRSSVFAVYSYGVDTLWLGLETPDVLSSVAGVEVGRVKGYQIWNLYSDPSPEELERASFRRDHTVAGADGKHPNATLTLTADLENIYTRDTIPKGVEGLTEELLLVSGVNTVCYRVQMENGYISPIRSFTVNVTDHAPVLNIAVENYIPSAHTSQTDGMINAHSVRFFVEAAYSLNGRGQADVQLWSDYGMNVGLTRDGERVTEFIDDPTPTESRALGVLAKGLQEEDFADFTENSYTSDFPTYNSLCSAIFAAVDEYGGITFVAPQLGDHKRVDVSGTELYETSYEISYYGGYYDDPYLTDDTFTTWRVAYNQPTYFGRELLTLTTTLEFENKPYEVLDLQSGAINYNLFNIVTNNVSFPLHATESETNGTTSMIFYRDAGNFHLINPNDAYLILSGDGIEGEVKLRLVAVTNPENPEELLGTDNTEGFIGADWREDYFSLYLANPTADEQHPDGTPLVRAWRIEGTNLTGQPFIAKGEVTLSYRTPAASAVMTESGSRVQFTFPTKEYGGEVRTGVFDNGSFPLRVTDYFGNTHDLTYTVTDDADTATDVSISKAEKTAHPVTVRLRSRTDSPITVNVTDYEIMSVTGNGSADVSVTVRAATRFSYTYLDSEGVQQAFFVNVDNIVSPAPHLVWSVDLNEVNGEGESVYRYGDVTVRLLDDNFKLVDRYTGKTPTFTFTPDSSLSHAFRACDIQAVLGDEQIPLSEDIAVRLPFELREIPDPYGSDIPDTEIPNLRVDAYASVAGVYGEKKLSLLLESANATSAFRAHGADYYTFRYVGSRASASSMLREMGWANDYRFALEVADSSRVRLFVKAGLYNEDTPDFDAGYSDVIPGVTLHSRLLTVTENAQFTLFAVDAKNNASQIAFDIQNLSDAPVARAVSVPMGESVRVYVIPPAEAGADFEILGSLTVHTDTDPHSEYFGERYLEWKENDDYEILYAYTYEGARVEGKIKTTVSGIIADDITEVGREYSANAEAEWTAQDVSATVYLSQRIEGAVLKADFADAPVRILTSGNVLTVTYTENAEAIEIDCVGQNGSVYTVRLSEISNIDKTAPTVREISRTLSADAKSITVVLGTDDRTLLAATGEAGAYSESENAYIYSFRLTENEEYVYRFANAAGALGEIRVLVTELVKEELSVLYSKSEDGADAVISAEALEAEIGEGIFIKPLRTVTALLSDGSEYTLTAGVWTEIVIPALLGGSQPYVTFTDAYGNVLTHQFSKIAVPDTQAPEIVLGRRVWSVREGTDAATVKSELLSNMTAFDAEGGKVVLGIELPESFGAIGVYDVVYTATDESGNTSRLTARLRVTSVYEPVLYAHGQKVNRDDGVYFSVGEEVTFSIDCAGLEWRAVTDRGIRTAAQMKDCVDFIYDYNTGDVLTLGALEAGTYTLCIITQNRDYFRILISVE